MNKSAVVLMVFLVLFIGCSTSTTANGDTWAPPSKKPLTCETYTGFEVCYDPEVGEKPDVLRMGEVVVLMDTLFPLIEFPQVQIFILPYKKFERRVLYKYPQFREGLKGGGGIVYAHTYVSPEGTWVVEAYEDMSDKLLIHELLHHVLKGSGERDVLHDHTIIESVVNNIMGSKCYKDFLRERW